jgi:hypothetical protein
MQKKFYLYSRFPRQFRLLARTGSDGTDHCRFVFVNSNDGTDHCRFVLLIGSDVSHHCRFVVRTGSDDASLYIGWARGQNVLYSFELSRAPLCSSTQANIHCRRALVFLHASGLASPCARLSEEAARRHHLPWRRQTMDAPAPSSSLTPPKHLCRARALFFVDAAVTPMPAPSTPLSTSGARRELPLPSNGECLQPCPLGVRGNAREL